MHRQMQMTMHRRQTDTAERVDLRQDPAQVTSDGGTLSSPCARLLTAQSLAHLPPMRAEVTPTPYHGVAAPRPPGSVPRAACGEHGADWPPPAAWAAGSSLTPPGDDAPGASALGGPVSPAGTRTPGLPVPRGPQAPEPGSLSPEVLGVSLWSSSSARRWQVAHGGLTLLRAESLPPPQSCARTSPSVQAPPHIRGESFGSFQSEFPGENYSYKAKPPAQVRRWGEGWGNRGRCSLRTQASPSPTGGGPAPLETLPRGSVSQAFRNQRGGSHEAALAEQPPGKRRRPPYRSVVRSRMK